MSTEPEWSVVVPAYNEAERIGRSLEQIGAYLAGGASTSEIIVVDDGSTDGTGRAVQAAAKVLPATVRLTVLANSPNQGKGAAVRRGCLAARGRYVLFTDADLATPIAEAGKLRAALDAGNDLAIGSRIHSDGRDMRASQPLYRQVLGRLYHRLAASLAVGDIQDTQCGFKAFTREAAAYLFSAQRTTGLVFDTELLFLARRAGLRIAEVPVVWSNVGGSRMRVTPLQAWKVLAGLIAIRMQHREAAPPPLAEGPGTGDGAGRR